MKTIGFPKDISVELSGFLKKKKIKVNKVLRSQNAINMHLPENVQ